MKKSFYKEYVFTKIGLTFFVTLSLLLLLNFYFKPKYQIDDTIVNTITALLSTIIVSICVGVYLDYRVSYNQLKDFDKLFTTKEEYLSSGILKYYDSFDDFDLNNFLRGKKEIAIYVNFANTVFGKIKTTFIELLKNKDVKIKIFVLHQDNKFISGLGELWKEYSDDYNEAGIKLSVNKRINDLKAIVRELKKSNDFKASLEVFLLKTHPVFYSCYKADNQLLFVPSKIISSKNSPIMAILTEKTITGGIYNRCSKDLNEIVESEHVEKLTFD